MRASLVLLWEILKKRSNFELEKKKAHFKKSESFNEKKINQIVNNENDFQEISSVPE